MGLESLLGPGPPPVLVVDSIKRWIEKCEQSRSQLAQDFLPDLSLDVLSLTARPFDVGCRKLRTIGHVDQFHSKGELGFKQDQFAREHGTNSHALSCILGIDVQLLVPPYRSLGQYAKT